MNRIQRMRAMTCLLICVLLTGLLPQTGARLSASGEVNLALGKAVTSSSSYENPAEGWARVHLTDGSKTGPYAPGSAANGWTTMPSSSQPAPGSPAWVKVDLGAAHWADQIVLWPRSDGGTTYTGVGFPVDFRILVSLDDQSWTEVGSWSGYSAPTNGAALTHTISAVQARYVKVEATALSRDNHQAYVMQLRELEVYQAASTLTDADAVAADHAELQLPYPQPLSSSIGLPTYGREGSAISWASSDPAVIDGSGRVRRPASDQPAAQVVLTATVSKGSAVLTKSFTMTVKPHRARAAEPEKFQIGVFWPPTWEYTNDQQYQWLKEAHVDVLQNVLGSGLDTEARNLRMLELAEAHDLKVNVADPRIRGTDAQIQEVVETYKDYWATGGYYIRDEPGIGELPREAHIYREVLEHDDTKNPYVNLFPNIYGAAYETDYVRAWVEEVGADNLRYLSYDNYPFLTNGQFASNYYDMADIIRRVGLEYGIKTASYLQSVGFGSSPSALSHRQPSANDMRFNVYSYLAYGFKYVTWFTYWTPTGRGEHFEDAIIDPQGNKTARYAPFQQLNSEMQQLGKTLIDLDAHQVYHTGATLPTASTKRLPADFYLQPANPADEMIVSYMVHQDTGETYAMVVNRSMTQSRTFTLQADSLISDIREISKTTGLEVASGYNAASGTLTASYQPGEGKLYALGELPYYDERHPYGNLAYQKPVTASSDVANWGWSKTHAVDGQRVGGAGAYDAKGWSSLPASTQPASPAWIAVDLQQAYPVGRVELWPRNDAGQQVGVGFPLDVQVRLSSDGTNWQTVETRIDVPQPVDGSPLTLTFPAQSARYVRVEAARLRTEPFGSYAFQLAELEVYRQ